jgi:SHS2 domain-containing protein
MSVRAGFELLEHTADVGIRSFGASVEDVFEQATRGLAEIIGAWRPDPDADGEAGDEVPVAVDADPGDLAGLLVDWLSEVLYLHEVRDAALGAVRVERVRGGRAEGTVRLIPAGRDGFEGTPVKAITYHRLKVGQGPDGWMAEVYLDI